MEDVLEVYQRQYADNEVLVCLDETSKQQVKEKRQPRPAQPGAVGSYDYEYERNGVSNLFMLFAPLEGWRRVEVTDRRTKVDWAQVVKQLVDEDYPDKDRIVLVTDNLNTHHPSSLYEAFEPAEARRIAQRLEIHYTPKHGSWLNMAEMEFSVLARACLRGRNPDAESLERAVNANVSDATRRPRSSTGASPPGTSDPNSTASTRAIVDLTKYKVGAVESRMSHSPRSLRSDARAVSGHLLRSLEWLSFLL